MGKTLGNTGHVREPLRVRVSARLRETRNPALTYTHGYAWVVRPPRAPRATSGHTTATQRAKVV
jgi:hypothetical protein